MGAQLPSSASAHYGSLVTKPGQCLLPDGGVCVGSGGAGSAGAAAGPARGKGSVLQCHRGLRASQPGLYGAPGLMGTRRTLLHQLSGALLLCALSLPLRRKIFATAKVRQKKSMPFGNHSRSLLRRQPGASLLLAFLRCLVNCTAVLTQHTREA